KNTPSLKLSLNDIFKNSNVNQYQFQSRDGGNDDDMNETETFITNQNNDENKTELISVIDNLPPFFSKQAKTYKLNNYIDDILKEKTNLHHIEETQETQETKVKDENHI